MKSRIIMTLALMTLAGAALANGSALTNGAQLFQNKACWSCHGKDGKSPLLPIYPKIAGQNALYVEKQMMDIKSGARVNGNCLAMKGVLPLVSNDEIKELAEFVSKLKP